MLFDLSSTLSSRGLTLVQYPLFRISQVFYIILSLASLPLLLYVKVKYIFGSTFHQNIKIYAIISSLIHSPCEFFPSNHLYTLLHLFIFGSNFGLLVSLVAMVIERSVATVRAKKYENSNLWFGIFLIIFTMIGIGAILFYLYEFDDFNADVWSIVVLPPGAIPEGKQIVFVYVIVSAVCISTLFFSSRFNSRRTSISNATLTSRFQTRENVITTQFVAHIASLHVFLFAMYTFGSTLAGILIARIFNNDEIIHTSIRHSLYV
ncbi:integral membrane protein Srb [Dictyocaulus viviparus]|uniref:Integral membrane protein Srb n=1 Tax=Dictyocaulus viviparus TaxID=29172 RepID=A0A0D8XV58_DICVI|nr:integral membrane protein Srb [Dictyocaulus viviparus]